MHEADPDALPRSIFRDRIRVLAEFGRDALLDIAIDRLLDQAVLRVAQAVEVGHSKIMQYRPEAADLLIVAGRGWKDGVVGTYRLRADVASPAGAALQTAQPVTINNAADAASFRIPELLVEHGIVSLANVPIMVDGQAWGVLEVDSENPDHFTPDDTDFLHAFASFLGAAIRRRRMEDERRQLAETNATSSAQVDILLRELQHRMKNNLQMILAIIALQRRKTTNPDASAALEHVGQRVTAIALAQDQLSTTQRLRTVNIGAYLRALCSFLDTARDNITIDADAEDMEMSTEQAVPAGLIINEAVTNALKHAFPDGKAGTIHVAFRCEMPSRTGLLSISDDGVGFSGSRTGSGRDLMKSLAAQLGGTIESMPATPRGTNVVVRFPIRV